MAESETIPEIVYHYTSIDTMMKIVASESIWATSVCYLNDTSEQSHFLKLVRSRIPFIQFEATEDWQAADSFLSKTNIEAGFETRPFIASFSADSDSLPQWRSYCSAGNGVAIGFSTNCLSRVAIKNGPQIEPSIRFDRVEYPDSDNGYPLIDEETLTCFKEAHRLMQVAQVIEGQADPNPFNLLSYLFRYVLLKRACFKKSASFRSENEYRVVVDTIRPRYDLLSYRTSRSCMIPFLELEIPRFEKENDKDPSDAQFSHPLMGGRYQFIKRVVVGPTSNLDLTLDTLRAFFRSNRLLVDVEPSTVSFRDW
jgi:hypothetical protein